MTMRVFADVDFDGVPLLMVDNLDGAAADADVPSTRGDAGFNLILVPRFDVDIGIVCFHAKLGLAGQVVGLGPVVSTSDERKAYNEKRNRKRESAHGSLQELGHTFVQLYRRRYAVLVRGVPGKS
jgi:hypothetical protein